MKSQKIRENEVIHSRESLDGLPHDILLEIVSYLDRVDNTSLGLMSKTLRQVCNDPKIWRSFVLKDFETSHHLIIQPFLSSTYHMRDLYISLTRSKTNVCGIPFANCENPKQFKKFCKNNKIEPFFFLNLLYLSRATTPCWTFWPDTTSHFGTVAHMIEVQNINVHGNVLVWAPGRFHVIWRLKISQDTFLQTVQFISEVDGNQHIYNWGDEDREGVVNNEWFDLFVHTIEVKKPQSLVKFSVLQTDLDFKYDLKIDYVELVPTLE